MVKKQGKMNSLVIVGGAMAIIMLFVIFTPAILGATAGDRDLEKYNGTSQAGNQTVKTASVIDTYLVGLTGMPLQVIAFFVAIFCVIAAVLWMGKKNKR